MKEKIAKLIDVKSIMTLILTVGFLVLTCLGEISGEQFLMIYTTVVAFYFGTQSEKNRQKQKGGDPAYLPSGRVRAGRNEDT